MKAGGGETAATILLADDEPMIRDMAARALRRDGFDVLTAASGDEALRVARESHGRIDLLVTDLVMPEMSGIELARRLSAQIPGLRVLFMSGYGDAALPASDQGASASFLPKPFTPSELLAGIRAALDERR
jgi:two-component system, cell cycle sensor histidine kinase and response regulator CckA